jgi:cellulose biosynthesis protein BcsQ
MGCGPVGWRVVTANNKGGAGKTATTVALAAALASLGNRVLAVDMDPQGNLTRRLGYDEVSWEGRLTLSDTLRLRSDDPADPAQVIVSCGWDHELAAGIDLLPSVPPKLEARQREAGRENGTEFRLRRVLDRIDRDYDVTLIDVPPGLGHLTDMALAAADRVVIVLMPEYDYVQGAVRMVHYVEGEREPLGRPDLRVAGVVVTNVDADAATHRAQLAHLPNLFVDELLWQPFIPHRRTWASANSDGLPIQLLKGRIAGELAELFTGHARQLIASLNTEGAST